MQMPYLREEKNGTCNIEPALIICDYRNRIPHVVTLSSLFVLVSQLKLSCSCKGPSLCFVMLQKTTEEI